MSRSHLLSLFLFTAITSAAPPPVPARPPGVPPLDARMTAAVAAPALSTVLKHNLAITQLELKALKLRDPRGGKTASPTELAAFAKTAAEKQAASWKEIEGVKRRLTGMLGVPETKGYAATALALNGLTRQLSSIHHEFLATLDSGKAWDSPEIKAVSAKAQTCSALQQEQMQSLIQQVKQLRAKVEPDKVAEKTTHPVIILMNEHRSLIKLLVDEITVRNRYLGTAIPGDVQMMLDQHPAQRERSLKEIAACMEDFHRNAALPFEDNFSAPAIKLDQAACAVRANMEEVLVLIRSGKSYDSPEAITLRAKADPARKEYSEAAVIIQKRLYERGIASMPEEQK